MFTKIQHKDKEPNILSQFGITDSAQVLVKTSTGLKVLDLYYRNSNKQLYAKNGNFFIALMRSGVTSNAKISWQELDGIDETYDSSYLVYVEPPKDEKLLGESAKP